MGSKSEKHILIFVFIKACFLVRREWDSLQNQIIQHLTHQNGSTNQRKNVDARQNVSSIINQIWKTKLQKCFFRLSKSNKINSYFTFFTFQYTCSQLTLTHPIVFFSPISFVRISYKTFWLKTDLDIKTHWKVKA